MFVRRPTIRKNRRSVRRPQGLCPSPSPIALTAVTQSSPIPTTPSPGPTHNGTLRPPNVGDLFAQHVPLYNYNDIQREPSLRANKMSHQCRGSQNVDQLPVPQRMSKSIVDRETLLMHESTTSAEQMPVPYRKLQTTVSIEEPARNSYQNHTYTTTTSNVYKGELSRTETSMSYDVSFDADYEHAHYGALLVQLREVSKDADNSCEFIARTVGVFCNSVIVTIFLGVLMGIPVAMMSVGVKYLSDCPRQPKVPIYLLVGGCFGLLFLIVIMWRQVQYRRLDSLDTFDDVADGRGANSSLVTDVILAIFQVVWLILGTVWVLSEWQPRYEALIHEPMNWCNKNAYVFAVVQIIGCYVMMSIALIVSLGLCVCYKCTNLFEPT